MHDKFVQKLISYMGASAKSSIGGDDGAHVSTKLRKINTTNSDNRVLDARFAIGVDNGAYLRSNVMPLHSVTDDTEIDLTSHLAPELERAGQSGMLEAVETGFKNMREKKLRELQRTLTVCEWLLSVGEIALFVQSFLEQQKNEAALNLARSNSLRNATNIEAACDVIRAILLIFDTPMDAVIEQWDKTLGADGTGTARVGTAIDRLAKAIMHTKAALDADGYASIPSDYRKSSTGAPVSASIDGSATVTTNAMSMETETVPRSFVAGLLALGGVNAISPAGVDADRVAYKRVLDSGLSTALQKTMNGDKFAYQVWKNHVVDLKFTKSDVQTALRMFMGDPKQDPKLREFLADDYEANIALDKAFDAVTKRLEDWKDSSLIERPDQITDENLSNFRKGVASYLKEENLTDKDIGYDFVQASNDELKDQIIAQAESSFDVKLIEEIGRLAMAAREDARKEAASGDAPPLQSDSGPSPSPPPRDFTSGGGGGGGVGGGLVSGVAVLAGALVDALGAVSGGFSMASREPSDAHRDTVVQVGDKPPKNVAQERHNTVDDGDGDPGDAYMLSHVSFCKRPPTIDANNVGEVENALCAAMSQLREDGGVERIIVKNTTGESKAVQFDRVSGVSPFWKDVGVRSPRPRDTSDKDWWSKTLWPGSNFKSTTELKNVIDGHKELLYPNTTVNERALIYALNRGLCGNDAPHHRRNSDVNGKLRYNLPSKKFPSGIDIPKSLNLVPESNAFDGVSIKPVNDFVSGIKSRDVPVEADSKLARWAPVEVDGPVPRLDIKGHARVTTLSVAESVVYEHLVDYYKALGYEHQDDPLAKNFYLACAAAAKVKQFKSMTNVVKAHARNPKLLLCNAMPSSRGKQFAFLTRPVMLCPDGGVMYPCDSGLAAFTIRAVEDDEVGVTYSDDSIPYDSAQGKKRVAAFTLSAIGGGPRVIVDRAEMTPFMRAAIDDDPTNDKDPPLYIASQPGTSNPLTYNSDTAPKSRVMDVDHFPQSTEFVDVDVLKSKLVHVLTLCEEIKILESRESDAKLQREQLKEENEVASKDTDMQECDARTRREAVWNDGLREASIAGDRLYAFVRQLSGAISESVDSVCQIDEGQLIRQQQQSRDRRARAADRAAQEHGQLVRNVFTSVIKDSEFILGIQGGGSNSQDVGELKVVSNTLRKQAQDLTQQGSGSEGFFTNAVKLEQLLTKGTGEMSLKDLFGSLRDAGLQMQRDAVQSEMDNGAPAGGASLEFLSAPRNSLVLRYKPEALSAIRESYDIFCKEMMYTSQKWRFHKISAWELMEGKDETLSNAFAVFCAHKLAHSRMFSSSHVGFVAQWPARANNTQLKIALRRLTTAANEYLSRYSTPHFASDKPAEARENYFR